MNTKDFAQLCRGVGTMLEGMAIQSEGYDQSGRDEVQFSPEHVAEAVCPLGRLIAAIAHQPPEPTQGD